MPQLAVEQTLQRALRHHQAGQIPQAEALYRQILQQYPAHADALHMLGIIAGQAGRTDQAVDLIRRAIIRKPDYPEAYGNLGVALKDQGQLEAAIAAFRQAIALNPGYAAAHYNLGRALKDQGQLEAAIAAYRQALALQPDAPETHCNLGNALKEQGQLEAAIAAYRQALALKPTMPEAHSNLGAALQAQGRLDDALAACRQALALNAALPAAHYNLGNVLQARGQPDAAIAAYRQALALQPAFAEAHYNLGIALSDAGQVDAAIAAYRQALALKPHYPEACANLGVALKDQGQLDAAIAACRQALALQPHFPAAYCNLGAALRDRGEFEAAFDACRQALALNPNLAEAHNNLGNVYKDQGQIEAAVAAYRQALALNPRYAEACSNLGAALKDQGQLDAACAAYRQALALDPHYAQALSNLGAVLKDMGQLDDALVAFRQAVTLAPDNAGIHSNLVYTLHFSPACDAQTLAAEHRLWNLRHGAPLRRFLTPRAHDRHPDRRLKVGYVSPDLRTHPVGRFLLPLLARHDKAQVELFAYAQVPAPDALTGQLRAHADHWRSLIGLSDAQAADLIRDDRIDILVDLSLHMAHNRLRVFARKPAPVQVTYLAYCSTTGLETMDYRLSDPYLDPPGMDESIYSEQTLRLPETYWCYQPHITPPEVGPLPAWARGRITFGCLNNFCKVSEPALAAWVQLLHTIPNSQLLVHAYEGTHRRRMRERLAGAGIEPQRVEFAGLMPAADYMALYSQIDLALDTFPYGGGTTTCDALWMGVPVVSLVGQTAVGRGGLSLLSNLGLPELAARSEEAYVRIARELAGDLPRLGQLRATLRRRMAQSPLMDAPRFARHVEAAYRHMWRQWCARA